MEMGSLFGDDIMAEQADVMAQVEQSFIAMSLMNSATVLMNLKILFRYSLLKEVENSSISKNNLGQLRIEPIALNIVVLPRYHNIFPSFFFLKSQVFFL